MNPNSNGKITEQILRIPLLAPDLARVLDEKYNALTLPSSELEHDAFLNENGEAIGVLITSAGVGASKDLIEKLPRLRAIVSFGVGFDSIDREAAQARSIVVSNTPDVLTDCVADLGVALLLDTYRQLSAADRFVRRGEWTQKYPLTKKLSGSKVGIVGLGRIGQAIAKRLEGFDIDISYHSRNEVPGSRYTYIGSLVELARHCDALVVATAGGQGTRNLVSREVLEALGYGVVVNVSRGSVVDEDALVDLLKEGKLRGAGLDVYQREPAVPKDLLELDSVVLAPHMGSGTEETRAAMAELTLRNLAAFLDGGNLVTPVG